MLGSLILYLKGMRIMMFQLSGFYYTLNGFGTLKPYYLDTWTVRGSYNSEEVDLTLEWRS